MQGADTASKSTVDGCGDRLVRIGAGNRGGYHKRPQ